MGEGYFHQSRQPGASYHAQSAADPPVLLLPLIIWDRLANCTPFERAIHISWGGQWPCCCPQSGGEGELGMKGAEIVYWEGNKKAVWRIILNTKIIKAN